MALTVLDPQTALIVVDLQKGIVGLPLPAGMPSIKDVVIPNARRLLDAFRQRKMPVVLVNVTGGAPGRNEQAHSGAFPEGWADLIPELNRQPSDHLVTKKTWGAFTNTDLHAWLQSQGVTQVVVLGVATSIGVESTARFAAELGYNVTLATDAVADMSAEAHNVSIKAIFPRMGETGTTQDILALLDRRG